MNQITGNLVNMTVPGFIRGLRGRLAEYHSVRHKGKSQREDEDTEYLFAFCDSTFSTANFNLPPKPPPLPAPFSSDRVGLVHYSCTRQVHRPVVRNETTISHSSMDHCYGGTATLRHSRTKYTVRLPPFSGDSVHGNNNIWFLKSQQGDNSYLKQ